MRHDCVSYERSEKGVMKKLLKRRDNCMTELDWDNPNYRLKGRNRRNWQQSCSHPIVKGVYVEICFAIPQMKQVCSCHLSQMTGRPMCISKWSFQDNTCPDRDSAMSVSYKHCPCSTDHVCLSSYCSFSDERSLFGRMSFPGGSNCLLSIYMSEESAGEGDGICRLTFSSLAARR